MKTVILTLLLLTGCSSTISESKSSLQNLQVSALKEYLTNNAVLSDPIIIENIVSSDVNDYKGIVKFKIDGTKRIQTVKCFGIIQDSDIQLIPLMTKRKLNIFCES